MGQDVPKLVEINSEKLNFKFQSSATGVEYLPAGWIIGRHDLEG